MKRMREERTMCYLVKNTQGDKILMRQVHFCPRESNRDYIHPATCCKHKTDNIYETMMYKTLDIKEEGTVIDLLRLLVLHRDSNSMPPAAVCLSQRKSYSFS